MLYKTNGIVLKTVKYSESSVIVKIYTRRFGLRSYLIRGTAGKKARIKKGSLQPLNILQLVVYNKEKDQLQNLKEIEAIIPFHHIPFDIRKSTVLMFLNEVLYKSIREEECNEALYDFLEKALLDFDRQETGSENFHLWFCAGLTRFLGFVPRNNYSANNDCFDLQEGMFFHGPPLHANHIDSGSSRIISQLLSSSSPAEVPLKNASDRNRMLEILISYYKLHLPNFKEVKSHQVLKQILN
ncbi:MAG: DNA repair protein RecO [Bacteroidales bacterium]